jgi:hypothetical protein
MHQQPPKRFPWVFDPVFPRASADRPKPTIPETRAHMAGLFANTPPSIIPKLWLSRFWIRAGGKYIGAAEVARAMSFNLKSNSGGLSPGSIFEPLAYLGEPIDLNYACSLLVLQV